jgi:diguanylate cyclase (GGDEF)-like protein
MLTGLLNSRGISEEENFFRDEYFLRGTDFVRMHIAINDFAALNEQYGFDFGDKVLDVLGNAFKYGFGRSSAVGRISGHKFAVLCQVESREEAHALRVKVKDIAESIKRVDDVPLSLYLSVGYVLFSETADLEEQKKLAEVRLHADHDQNISAQNRLAHASEIFHLFDDLPLSYSVYHITHAEHSGLYDAVIFYVNHKYEELGELPAKAVLGHSVRELYPYIGEEWFECVRRAALDGETVEGDMVDAASGRTFRFAARQIIYPGYCAVTYTEPEWAQVR